MTAKRPPSALNALFFAVTLVGTAACSSDQGGTRKGPCTNGELAGCGVACSSTDPCMAGLACVDGVCSAECSGATAARDCGEGAGCTPDGQCVPADMDGGTGGGGRGDGGGGNSGDGDGGDICASVELVPTPAVPNVMFIIDQSGSMNEDFDDGKDRWTALKDVLLDDEGLIAELQDSVNFGVVLYTGAERNPVCPLLTTVEIAQNNLEGIRAVYGPADYAADTPTGDSIDAVVASAQIQSLLAAEEPVVFILATDGEPDRCEELNPQRGQEESVSAVERAFALGIRTYVVAVAREDELSQEHVNDLANAGQGVDGAESFRVASIDELQNDLRTIVAGEISCEVPLQGRVTTEDPCEGVVKLGAMTLECNGADGWRLEGDSTIVLTGAACDALREGAALSASFPCGAAIPVVL